jgi:hypothetical protein
MFVISHAVALDDYNDLQSGNIIIQSSYLVQKVPGKYTVCSLSKRDSFVHVLFFSNSLRRETPEESAFLADEMMRKGQKALH